MKVSDVMTRHVLTVSPDTSLRKVQSLMLRYHLNDLLVVEDSDKWWRTDDWWELSAEGILSGV